MKYWKYILVYVDDVFAISTKLYFTMEHIEEKFKMRGEKMYLPDMYLSALLTQSEGEDG